MFVGFFSRNAVDIGCALADCPAVGLDDDGHACKFAFVVAHEKCGKLDNVGLDRETGACRLWKAGGLGVEVKAFHFSRDYRRKDGWVGSACRDEVCGVGPQRSFRNASCVDERDASASLERLDR